MLDPVGTTLRVRPTGRALGADIEDLDLADLDDAAKARLKREFDLLLERCRKD